MQDLNSVVEIGRLVRDIDLRYSDGGLPIGNLSIAVNRSVKKGEQWEEEASFFDVTVYGRIAEALKPHLTKGQQVAVMGYLKQSTWEKDGEKRSKVVIVAEHIQLVGGKRDSSGSSNGNYNDTGKSSGYQGNDYPSAPSSSGFSEDIPF